MPKDWGISGERLRLNLDIQFSGNQLYGREEFLGGVGGAKELIVKDEVITLSPSLTEGSRNFKCKSGGWRVCESDGPLGTNILRFYIEIEENIKHKDSQDIYCPSGRIYCTCGYFPLRGSNNGALMKESLEKELEEVTQKCTDLNTQLENEGFFSMEKIQLTRKLMKERNRMTMVVAKLNDLKITDPDRRLLKINGDAALTKEGGVCCKVTKEGPVKVVEYHILGRFSCASTKDKNEKSIMERVTQ